MHNQHRIGVNPWAAAWPAVQGVKAGLVPLRPMSADRYCKAVRVSGEDSVHSLHERAADGVTPPMGHLAVGHFNRAFAFSPQDAGQSWALAAKRAGADNAISTHL